MKLQRCTKINLNNTDLEGKLSSFYRHDKEHNIKALPSVYCMTACAHMFHLCDTGHPRVSVKGLCNGEFLLTELT